MITLKSHAIPASSFNTPTIRFYDGKPETTVIGETTALRDRLPWEQVHLRQAPTNPWCVMCQTVTGPSRPWMDKIDQWQEHPMRCR